MRDLGGGTTRHECHRKSLQVPLSGSGCRRRACEPWKWHRVRLQIWPRAVCDRSMWGWGGMACTAWLCASITTMRKAIPPDCVCKSWQRVPHGAERDSQTCVTVTAHVLTRQSPKSSRADSRRAAVSRCVHPRPRAGHRHIYVRTRGWNERENIVEIEEMHSAHKLRLCRLCLWVWPVCSQCQSVHYSQTALIPF